MAKGRRTRKSSASKRPRAPRAATAPTVPASAAALPSAAPASRAAASKKVDLVTDYHYVLRDLKRLGILAASMFVVLIVLALTIR